VGISEGKYALGALTVFALWLFVGLPWLLTSDWGLSDKIAVIASVAAFLQFVVLFATVWVMIVNGRRQLRPYVVVQSAEFIEQGQQSLSGRDKSDVRNSSTTSRF
jgi:hypothetical protein